MTAMKMRGLLVCYTVDLVGDVQNACTFARLTQPFPNGTLLHLITMLAAPRFGVALDEALIEKLLAYVAPLSVQHFRNHPARVFPAANLAQPNRAASHRRQERLCGARRQPSFMAATGVSFRRINAGKSDANLQCLPQPDQNPYIDRIAVNDTNNLSPNRTLQHVTAACSGCDHGIEEKHQRCDRQ